MKQIFHLLWNGCRIAFGLVFITSSPVFAQIVPDVTLPKNSIITSQGNTSIITGGTRAGNNLFHSFAQFSVFNGNTAYFNNALDIQNIISRVTGSSISNIDGLIRANGAANLFLINPNGTTFGSNASLNIGGSLMVSTASSLKFADGTQFRATAPQTTPLLTISVPIGLQFGNTPGRILVQGAGNNVFYSLATPIIGAGSSPTGLRVQPGKTLALIGGDIVLDGGTLTATGGRIELGSVRSGTVSLKPSSLGWNLGYEGVPAFANIQLSKLSAVDASGVGGSIQVQGDRVTIADGSSIFIQNQGFQSSSGISVKASESLDLIGSTSQAKILSGLLSETVGAANAGDITISTKRLVLQDGGGINTKTFTTGTGGNVIVNASDSVTAIGFSPASATSVSGIGAYTFNKGDSGNIAISTGQLKVLNGATLISGTFGFGRGGNTTVNANEIEIAGLNSITSGPSSLQSSTFNNANAGNLRIDTANLIINNGGQISSSTFATGNAGLITIKASDSLNIGNASGIISSAIKPNKSLQQILPLTLPPILTGSPGSVTINTGHLNLTNNSLISVSNQGLGDAGSLQINTNSTNLNNGSSIVAVTASGKGGNIQVQAQDLQLGHNSFITASAITPEENITLLPVNANGTGNNGSVAANAGSTINGGNITLQAHDLRLRQGSNISATAYGRGNGGNLAINTGALAALENSDITANAVQGNGGNIQINTQGLFQSPDSQITASSQLGINGNVQLNTLSNNSTLAIAPLPIVTVDPAKLIAQGCPANVGPRAEFIVTGSGGLPPSPSDSQTGDTTVEDLGTTSTQSAQDDRPTATTLKDPRDGDPYPAQIVEATGFETNAKGEVVGIVANAPTYTPAVPWLQPTTCHPQ